MATTILVQPVLTVNFAKAKEAESVAEAAKLALEAMGTERLYGKAATEAKALAMGLWAEAFPNVEAPKSYSARVMLEKLSDANFQPGTRNTVKAQAKAEFVAKFGFAAPKTYSAERIKEVVASGVAPKTVGRGGLTGEKCRKLIAAGIALGIVPKAEATGRSKWNAETLRKFVVAHKLETRITVNAAE